MPELDVRWRRFSVSAKGRHAIDAIRKPLFILLLLNAAVAGLAVITAVLRPDWLAIKDAVAAWIQ